MRIEICFGTKTAKCLEAMNAVFNPSSRAGTLASTLLTSKFKSLSAMPTNVNDLMAFGVMGSCDIMLV
jgi:hypothetical protein